MRFFNILAQRIAVLPPGDQKLGPLVLDFQQDANDAMVQRLVITPPEGGPQLTVLFSKAGAMAGYDWEKQASDDRRADATQLDADTAKAAGLKPGQSRVTPAGNVEQAPAGNLGMHDNSTAPMAQEKAASAGDGDPPNKDFVEQAPSAKPPRSAAAE